jgi:alcohol dehydrogenase class IV
MLAHLALIDPELTYSMPPLVTATTGLDAFTQLLEAFVSHRASPLTDGICREGLRRAARSLTAAYFDGENAAAREDMCLASLFGGLALANAKLGAVHGLAGALGGRYKAAHGALCAALLSPVMAANINALQTRNPDSIAIARYDAVAQLVTGIPDARALDGVAWIEDLCLQLNMSALPVGGLTAADISDVVAQSLKASSMQGNPIELNQKELAAILRKAAGHQSPGHIRE